MVNRVSIKNDFIDDVVTKTYLKLCLQDLMEKMMGEISQSISNLVNNASPSTTSLPPSISTSKKTEEHPELQIDKLPVKITSFFQPKPATSGSCVPTESSQTTSSEQTNGADTSTNKLQSVLYETDLHTAHRRKFYLEVDVTRKEFDRIIASSNKQSELTPIQIQTGLSLISEFNLLLADFKSNEAHSSRKTTSRATVSDISTPVSQQSQALNIMVIPCMYYFLHSLFIYTAATTVDEIYNQWNNATNNPQKKPLKDWVIPPGSKPSWYQTYTNRKKFNDAIEAAGGLHPFKLKWTLFGNKTAAIQKAISLKAADIARYKAKVDSDLREIEDSWHSVFLDEFNSTKRRQKVVQAAKKRQKIA
jgi:hypothetical protein